MKIKALDTTVFQKPTAIILRVLGYEKDLLPDDIKYKPPVPTQCLQDSFCFDVVQGQMNGPPNETHIHSWKFSSLAC